MIDRPAEPTTEELLRQFLECGTDVSLNRLCESLASLTVAKEAAEKQIPFLQSFLEAAIEQIDQLLPRAKAAEKQCEELRRALESPDDDAVLAGAHVLRDTGMQTNQWARAKEVYFAVLRRALAATSPKEGT